MNILVCIKQVPASSEVEVDEATGVLKRESAGGKINPYDLFALEQAFCLRQAHGGQVHVLTMGPPQARAVLLEALYMGADTGTLLTDRRFAGADVVATSYALAEAVKKMGQFELILCGKQTTDGDTAQVGPEMAELLGVPHACYVRDIAVQPEGVRVLASYGGYSLIQQMPVPCLLTLEKDINTPRLPSYLRRLETRPEQISTLTLDDLGDSDESHYGLKGSPTQVERIFPPPKSEGHAVVEGTADEVAAQMYTLLAEGKFLQEGGALQC